MGFLRGFGWFIIIVSVVGSGYGFYLSAQLSNGYFALVSFVGLAGGCYVGYLGVKVDEMDENPGFYVTQLGERVDRLTERVDAIDKNTYDAMEELETRVKKLEERKS